MVKAGNQPNACVSSLILGLKGFFVGKLQNQPNACVSSLILGLKGFFVEKLQNQPDTMSLSQYHCLRSYAVPPQFLDFASKIFNVRAAVRNKLSNSA